MAHATPIYPSDIAEARKEYKRYGRLYRLLRTNQHLEADSGIRADWFKEARRTTEEQKVMYRDLYLRAKTHHATLIRRAERATTPPTEEEE
jgi:hypothetical protein